MKRLFQHITAILLLLTASIGPLAAAEYVTAVFTETEAGKAWDVDIRLRNTNTNYTAFQMDLSLPDGVSYVEGSLAPSSRIATHSALASTLSDGKLRLLAYSATNTAITGVGENSILTLKLKADQTLSPGNYPVTISNILISLRTGVERSLEDADVALTASSYLTKSYHLIYMVDGVEYARQEHEAGSVITPLAAPEKEGYTFSGWQNLPEVMPENDVTVTGTFTVNTYVANFYLDGKPYAKQEVAFGATIPLPEVTPAEGYAFSGWQNVPTTMPAHDIDIHGTTIDTGIESIFTDATHTILRQATDIRDLSGRLIRQDATTLRGLPRGIYLIGTQKVFVR